MKYSIQCPHCSSAQVAYTFPLNASLVSAFIRFAEKFMENGRKGMKKPAMGLTNSQYTNFHKLHHFGIIRQYEESGEWWLTEFGEKFYYAEEGVLNPAGFMAGETLGPNHEAWATHKGERKMVFITEVLPTHYKQRPEYREEKQPNLFDSL